MLGVGVIVPILPLYAQEMGASAFMVGLIFSSFSASRALVVPYVGILSDRMGRKLFLEIGLLGYAILAVVLLWTPSPLGLVVNRTVQGVFAAMILPVTMAMVAELSLAGREGTAFGSFNTWLLLGFGIGPVVGGLAYDLWGVWANFLSMAFTSLISLAMVHWLVPARPVKLGASAPPSWGLQLALLKDRPMLGVFLCRAGQALGMGCFVAFVPVLGHLQGLDSTRTGALLTINVLAMIAVQVPAGRLADRLPRLPLAGWGQVVSGLCKMVLPLTAGFWPLAALMVLEGLAAGFSLPALTAYATQRGRELNVGMGVTMGFFTLAMSLGVFIGPIAGGWLSDIMGMTGAFYLAGAATLLGALALAPLAGGGAKPLQSAPPAC